MVEKNTKKKKIAMAPRPPLPKKIKPKTKHPKRKPLKTKQPKIMKA